MKEKKNIKNIPTGADTSLIKIERGDASIKIMSHNVNHQYYKDYDRVVPATLRLIKYLVQQGQLSISQINEFLVKLSGEDWDIW